MKPNIEDKPFEFMPTVARTQNAADAPREFDVVQMALRHKWPLIIGVLAGLALGNIAFVKLGPEYNAVAQILVSRRAQVPIRESLAYAWGERTEHVAIIKSPMIVGKAVEQGELAKLTTLHRSTDPVEDILDGLEVKRTAGQDSSFLNVFELKYRNKNAADARAVINAIILAYRDYVAESQEEVSDELTGLLEKMNSELSQQIASKQQELLDFRKNAPLVWRTAPGDQRQPGDVTNVHQERVVEIQKERTANLLRRAEISGKVKALQNAIDQGRSREELETLVRLLIATAQSGGGQGIPGSAVTTPPGAAHVEQASAQLLPLLLEEQKLLRDYAEDHPDVQNVRRSIARVKQFFEARGVVLPELAGRDATGLKVDFVDVYLQLLRQQLDELDNKEIELTRLYDAESQNVKGVVKYMVEDQALSEQLDQLKSQWNAIVAKVSEMSLTQENKGYSMKLLAPVREEWSLKRYLKIVGAATMLLMGLCIGVVILREWRDTTIKSADDVRQLLNGASVLGSVPRFATKPLGGDSDALLPPALCYFHRPGSAEAESYRTVRTALLVGLDASRQKVIQVSSPEPGDGKSTVAANLGIALAQSGKRVLLLDADLRRPTIHSLFRARPDIGTTDVLDGEIQLANAVQESAVDNLWVLASGTQSSNPAEMLASEQFDRLVAEARREFDIVLIDTPPLLVVSDPSIVAPRTDGLLLVTRTNKNTRTAIWHTRELLTQHGMKLLGVVANGIEHSDVPGNAYSFSKSYADYLQPSQQPPRNSNRPRQKSRQPFGSA